MQRKDFIKSLGILAATSLSTDVIGNTLKVNANSLQIKKGLGYWMIKEDLSLLDKFKLVKDLGFDGIEFNSPLDIPLKDLLEALDKTVLRSQVRSIRIIGANQFQILILL